jgi:hypothetical protein
MVSITSGRLVDMYSGTISLGVGAATAGIAFAAARTEKYKHSRRSFMVPSAVYDTIRTKHAEVGQWPLNAR